MLKILRASAGSGKTHALALEYLRLLLKEDNPDAYRHILAVTFTNKATEEMKRRILKELFILSKTPQESRLLARLEKLPGADETTLQKRAARALSLILHDYSAFSVSTIDRFFQQTLRAFSREIGQFSSYQVHLDREELVTQSVDLVLDSLQEGKTLDWLTEGAKADLAKTGRFSLEARLGKMAATLRDLPPEAPIPSRESLWELGKACGEVAKSFEMDVTGAVKAIRSCLESEGVSPGDTNRHWLSGTLDLYDGKSFPRPRDSFFTNAPDPDKWFPKSRQDLKTRLEGKLEAPLGKLLELYGPRYREYLTAVTISDQIYGLGVADTLREAFVRIQKEKNVISIDDSNTILHGIIDLNKNKWFSDLNEEMENNQIINLKENPPPFEDTGFSETSFHSFLFKDYLLQSDKENPFYLKIPDSMDKSIEDSKVSNTTKEKISEEEGLKKIIDSTDSSEKKVKIEIKKFIFSTKTINKSKEINPYLKDDDDINKINRKYFRVEDAKKHIKKAISQFATQKLNSLIQSSELGVKFKKVIHLPNYKLFTSNSKELDNLDFLSFSVKKIFTYGKKDGNRQDKNEKNLSRILEYKKYPEKTKKIKEFLELTYKDIIKLFYKSSNFDEFKNSKLTIFFNEGIKDQKKISLLEDEGLLKLFEMTKKKRKRNFSSVLK